MEIPGNFWREPQKGAGSAWRVGKHADRAKQKKRRVAQEYEVKKMTNSEKARKDIEDLSAGIFRIEAAAQKENRALTTQEDGLVAEMEGAIKLKTDMLGSEGPLTQPGAHLGGGSHSQGNGRDYASLFNLSGGLSSGGFKDSTEFLNAIDSGRFDPRLKILASMGENLGSEGGYSVPTQFLSSWLDSSLKSEIARKYARLYPMTSSAMLVPGWDAKDFSSGEYAGMKMNFHAEGATATAQDAKMRQIQMTAYQGAIYVNASLELVSDGAGFGVSGAATTVGLNITGGAPSEWVTSISAA